MDTASQDSISMRAELCKNDESRQEEMMPVYAYCLFCETQRCNIISEYIIKNYGYQCLSPQIVQRKWVKGVPVDENHDWLPGYLFIYSDQKISTRFEISGIIRCLGDGELKGQDLKFAEMIRNKDGVMGNMTLIREGDRCKISDPAWQEMRGTVTKIDRGRKRCCIEYTFDGAARKIWAGYEIVEKE